jgi:hypothetical protein
LAVADREGSTHVNPYLPDSVAREWLPVCAEISCWFDDATGLRETLAVLYEHFGADSVLAAIRFQDNARLLLYTSAPHSAVHDRQSAARATLRPTAMGLRVLSDPRWEELHAFVAAAGKDP